MSVLAPAAVTYPPAGTLEVLAVDDDGAVKVAFKRAGEPWSSPPHPLSATGFAPGGAPLAAVHHPPGDSLEAFVVTLPPGVQDPAQGVVQMLWKAQGVDGSAWHPPQALTEPASCPVSAGGHLAGMHYATAGTLEVPFVDSRGAIRALWKRGLEAWQPPATLSPDGSAPAGAPIAVAHHPPGDSIEAFVVGPPPGVQDPAQGVVQMVWKAQGVDDAAWHPPQALTDPRSCPVPLGARLCAVHHPPGGTLEVLFVDSRGAVRVLWKRETEAWQSPPNPLTHDGFAPPGAPIAALHYAGHDQLEVVVAGHDALWLLWKVRNGGWQGPIALTEPGSTAGAAPVSAVHHTPGDTLEVLIGDPSFFARVAWKEHNRRWRPCAVPIGPRSGASSAADAETTHVAQVTGGPEFKNAGAMGTDLGANTVHRGEHWVFFGDVPRFGPGPGPPFDADVVARARRMTPDSVELTPVVGPDGLFLPFAIRRPDVTFTPQTVQTPTGAFSDGDRAYVFVLVHEGPNGEVVPRPVPGGKVVSYLTASSDPGTGEPYDLVFRWAESRFWQVAPWVVRDPGAVGLPAGAGEGVLLLGHGFNDAAGGDAVHLAWLPLPLAADARASIRYFNGEADPGRWSSAITDARPLWPTLPGYTSVSLAWFAEPGRWVALYSKALLDNQQFRPRRPVIARVAPDPVALGSAPELTLFDPCRDAAYGRYMHWPDLDRLHQDPPGMPDEPGWPYGAHILAPLAGWDPAGRTLTLHYLLSTSRPYQVQHMRSRFAIPQ